MDVFLFSRVSAVACWHIIFGYCLWFHWTHANIDLLLHTPFLFMSLFFLLWEGQDKEKRHEVKSLSYICSLFPKLLLGTSWHTTGPEDKAPTPSLIWWPLVGSPLGDDDPEKWWRRSGVDREITILRGFESGVSCQILGVPRIQDGMYLPTFVFSCEFENPLPEKQEHFFTPSH